MKKGYTIDETIQNFNTCIPQTVQKDIIVCKEPDFSKAYCNIWIQAEKYIDNKSIIIYFEDDWIINDNFKWKNRLDTILKHHTLQDKFLLINQIIPDNSPHCVSIGYYKEFLVYVKMNRDNLDSYGHPDPDSIKHCFSKFFIKKKMGINNIRYNTVHYSLIENESLVKPFSEEYYGCENTANYVLISENGFVDIKNKKLYEKVSDEKKFEVYIFRHFSPNIVKDIGRVWLKNINVSKWKKTDKNEKTY